MYVSTAIPLELRDSDYRLIVLVSVPSSSAKVPIIHLERANSLTKSPLGSRARLLTFICQNTIVIGLAHCVLESQVT